MNRLTTIYCPSIKATHHLRAGKVGLAWFAMAAQNQNPTLTISREDES